MSNAISKEDLRDLDIVDSYELRSDGVSLYLTLPLNSISAGGIFTVDISSLLVGIISEPAGTVEAGDRIYVFGASPESVDGYYTISSILTESTFTVEEATTEAAGGTVHFLYCSGASRVGFDSSGLTHTSADNVQEAIEDIDAAIVASDGYLSIEDDDVEVESTATVINFGKNLDATSEGGGKVTIDSPHASLRELIHLADGVGGPFEEFASGAYREILPAADPFPTSVIWWESSSKSKKIVEKTITRNPNKTPSNIEWKAYGADGSTVLAVVSDDIIYDGVFELNRTRTIS